MKKLITAILAMMLLVTTTWAAGMEDAIEIREAPPIEVQDELQPFYAGVTVSEYEQDLLERILWAEANDQSFNGQKAVIEVIFNRLRSPEWPNTIEGVLSQKGQFSTWRSRNKVRPTETQSDVISEVLSETEPVIPGDYVFFATRKHKWMHDCFRIEGHYFGR